MGLTFYDSHILSFHLAVSVLKEDKRGGREGVQGSSESTSLWTCRLEELGPYWLPGKFLVGQFAGQRA